MQQCYGCPVFCESTAIAAVVGLEPALKVIGDSGVELGVVTLDDVDVPGHGAKLIFKVLHSAFSKNAGLA